MLDHYFQVGLPTLMKVCYPSLIYSMQTTIHSIYVTDSVKMGLIADPNCTYLESHNLTCEFTLL